MNNGDWNPNKKTLDTEFVLIFTGKNTIHKRCSENDYLEFVIPY